MQQMSNPHQHTISYVLYVCAVSEWHVDGEKKNRTRGEEAGGEKRCYSRQGRWGREEVGRVGGKRRKTGGDEVKRREVEHKIMEEKGRWRDSEGESEGGLDARGGWERYKHWGWAARRDVEKQMGLLRKRERKDERGGGQLQRSKPSWCLAWHNLCQHNNVSRKPGWQTTGMRVQRGEERKGGGVRDGRQEKGWVRWCEGTQRRREAVWLKQREVRAQHRGTAEEHSGFCGKRHVIRLKR